MVEEDRVVRGESSQTTVLTGTQNKSVLGNKGRKEEIFYSNRCCREVVKAIDQL